MAEKFFPLNLWNESTLEKDSTRVKEMTAIKIVHSSPAFILIYEDVIKGGQHARVICEFVADEEMSIRHRSAVCVYSSHVDALIDARIQESMSGIKHHAINLSDFDSSEMYHAES